MAGSITDIVSAVQNAVVAMNSFAKQLTGSFNNIAAKLPPAPSPISNSIGADVPLNNIANYFDGPIVVQGTIGTWFVSGTVTLISPNGDSFLAKLWDGTTVIASAVATNIPGFLTTISLSGYIVGPTGNLRISVRDFNTVNGAIAFNNSGNSKDSTITAIRIV